MLRALALLAALAGTAIAEPKRDVPDYDGRGNPDAKPSPGLWFPRIVLAPLYFLHEYFVRRPLGSVLTTAERDHWKEQIERVVYWGPNREVFIYPTFLYDFGTLPSAGLSVHWSPAFAPTNAIHVHFGTWGPAWLAAHADDRYTWNDGVFANLARIEFVRRQDNLFLGVGPDVTDATRARYGLRRIDGSETLQFWLGRESMIAASVGVRASDLREGTCCDDPSLTELAASGGTMLPPGYDPSHTTIYGRLALRLDSRGQRPANGTGAYLELHGENHHDIHDEDAWLRYGGETGVSVDLTGRQRVLKLGFATELVDPIGMGSDVPFYELAQLGGDDTMSGFIPGWMNGRSVVTGGLAYTWPVWTLLDAQLRFSVGNAFGEHLSGFTPGKLRMSADVGIVTIYARDERLQLLFGLGTETFEQGAGVTSVRLSLGTRRGF
jgi:hypothetical protein